MDTLKGLLVLVAGLALLACTEHPIPVLGEALPVTVTAGDKAVGPRLSRQFEDTVILSWMERRDAGATLRFSVLRNTHWQAAVDVITDPDMFVNWADLPSVNLVAADSLLVHWLSYRADKPYAYDILTSRSSDNGATWSDPRLLHSDGTETEHGFVSVYQTGDGAGLIWLDGRKTGGKATDSPVDTGMTLRHAVLHDDGTLAEEIELDNLICDCCPTDTAIADDGPIVVYRDRTADDIRDIYTARKAKGEWQPGVRISEDNWRISGCPVNGPAIAAERDNVAVVWFTAANDKPVVKAALSTNSGKTYSAPMDIATRKVLGRVGVVAINANAFAVTWLESDDEKSFLIKARTITSDGRMGKTYKVGRTGVASATPQLSRSQDHLILAWTDEISEVSRVLSVRVPILGFYEMD